MGAEGVHVLDHFELLFKSSCHYDPIILECGRVSLVRLCWGGGGGGGGGEGGQTMITQLSLNLPWNMQ